MALAFGADQSGRGDGVYVIFLFLLQLTTIFTAILWHLQMHQFAFGRWLQVPRHTFMTYLIDIPLLFGVKPTSWSLTEAVQHYHNLPQNQTSFMFSTVLVSG